MVGKRVPEKDMWKGNFPSFKQFCGALGESNPTGQLCGNVPLPEKPLCALTTARRGSGLPGRSRKTWPVARAGAVAIATGILALAGIVKAVGVLLLLQEKDRVLRWLV